MDGSGSNPLTHFKQLRIILLIAEPCKFRLDAPCVGAMITSRIYRRLVKAQTSLCICAICIQYSLYAYLLDKMDKIYTQEYPSINLEHGFKHIRYTIQYNTCIKFENIHPVLHKIYNMFVTVYCSRKVGQIVL